MTWVEIVKEMGPFTAPLCIAMGFAIRWILKWAYEIKTERDAALLDAQKLRDQRTTDQVAATEAMGDASRVVTDALREHDGRIDAVLKKLQGDP